MIVLAIAATAGAALGLIIFGLHRRHRARPSVHQIMMANHIWQPRKFK